MSPNSENRFRARRPILLAVIILLLFLVRIPRIQSLPQAVAVHPGDNLQAIVNSHPPATQFKLDPGIYRMQSVVPKDGDTFTGGTDVQMNGAQLLTHFGREGELWKAGTGAKPRGEYRGKCDEDRPACIYPEDLFVDNVMIRRVDNLSDMGPGRWYLDYKTGEAFLADDPAGHTVEISVVPTAFSGSARNVTIQNLTIEKYASTAGQGAIESKSESGPPPGKDWVVEHNVVQFNHGVGIWAGPGMKVLNNQVVHNGQMGLGGSGADILVDGNEIAFNNEAGYYYPWEAGGTKFVFTHNLVVRNNFSHDNKGPGLWTDLENAGTLYENNHTARNQGAGIQHEVSYQAVIKNNVIENDGYSGLPGKTSPWYGAGIVVAGSSDVEVSGNTVSNCMNGIIGRYPRRELSHEGKPYVLRNLNVHDNTIAANTGIAAGIIKSGGLSDDVFTSWNNRFSNNTFRLMSPDNPAFAWMNSLVPAAKWREQFHEN